MHLHDNPNPARALISALVDGELTDPELDQLLSQWDEHPTAGEIWDSYHQVGDVLRSTQTCLLPHDPDFVAKLRAKLREEMPPAEVVTSAAAGNDHHWVTHTKSANDPWWRRVSGVASVALVAVLVWQGYGVWRASDAPGSTPELAQRPEAPMVAIAASRPDLAASAVMVRDPRLDALLSAHREFGGTSALQMPSGFLRNATFEEGRP